MAANPKKVLFLTYGLQTGGAQTLIVDLLNHLDPDVLTPVIVTLGGPGEAEKRLRPARHITRFPRRWKFDLHPAKQLAELMRQEGIQDAFVHGFFCFFFMRLALRIYRKPVKILISLHSTKARSLGEYLLWMTYARLLSGKEKLVTVCHSQARYLSQTYFVPLRYFETIYNGIDTRLWQPAADGWDRKAERQRWDIPPEANVIVQVALFRSEKKHEDSLRALAWLKKNTKCNAYLLFVGSGATEREQLLRRLANDLGVTDRVRFCGIQSDVRPFYWMSDLFTLSSVAIETFSIAALEAMATGLPCVLTDLGGAREMVHDGVNGYVVPPGKPELLAGAWNRIFCQEPPADRMAIRQRVVEQFSIEACVGAYEKEFQS